MFPTPSHIDALQTGLAADLRRFLPELVVCGGIVLLLFCRLLKALDRWHLGVVAAFVLGVALFDTVVLWKNGDYRPGQTVFTGMLAADPFAAFVRVVVLAAALVTVLFTLTTRIPDADDSGDFYTLLLGGTLGMMLMAAASHLLMV